VRLGFEGTFRGLAGVVQQRCPSFMERSPSARPNARASSKESQSIRRSDPRGMAAIEATGGRDAVGLFEARRQAVSGHASRRSLGEWIVTGLSAFLSCRPLDLRAEITGKWKHLIKEAKNSEEYRRWDMNPHPLARTGF